MSQLRNLDRLAARMAQDIVKGGGDAKKLENLATKALGVVQENGVYAGMLFLYSRTSKEDKTPAEAIRTQLLAMLGKDEIVSLELAFTGNAREALWLAVSDHLIGKVTSDLDKLLLVKELYEQTLIYVRYGAKAAGSERDGHA